MKFWAHSDPAGLPPESPGSSWQLLAEHLANVANLSRHLAQLAAPEHGHFHNLAERTGLLHDYGKYTDCFQRMIRGEKLKCPHSIHGAAMEFCTLNSSHIASAVAGHHAGMPDWDVLRSNVKTNQTTAQQLLDPAATDLPALSQLLRGPAPTLQNPGNRFDLLTRMLLSCLVDADRLDTAHRKLVQAPLAAASRLDTLLSHLRQLADQSPEGIVKGARQEVLADCLHAAASPHRIFSLSVPTGGGKTLAAMAFALKRAALFPERYRRIIIVGMA